QLAASIAPDPGVRCTAEVVSREQLPTIEWEDVSLLIWHAPLPDADTARYVEDFVAQGGQVIFYPPKSPNNNELYGVRWQSWKAATGGSLGLPPHDEKERFRDISRNSSSGEGTEDVPVETWRGDQDLLA